MTISEHKHGSYEGDLDHTVVYDTSVEPLATPEEHREYQRVLSQKEQEKQQLAARFSGEQPVDPWY